MKNIIQFRPVRGVNTDLPPSEVDPEWYTRANNIQFRDGYAERTKGDNQVYGALISNLRNVLNIRNTTGTNYWVYTGADSITAVTGSTHTDITPVATVATLDTGDDFTVDDFNGLLTWNNGSDVPHYWGVDPGTPLQPLPGWVAGDVAYSLRPFKYHLFALGMTEGASEFPMKVKWSSAAPAGAVPGTWVPAADNEAGDTILADTPGRIVDAVPLRDSLVIYKETSTYIANYIGGQFVYQFRKLFETSGIMARNCAVEQNGRHYVLADDDIVVHDGNTVKSLLDKRARRAVFGAIDQANFKSSFVVNYEKRREIWFCIPTAGEDLPNLAIIYNLDEDAWGLRSIYSSPHASVGIVNDTAIDESWDSDSQAWDDDQTTWVQQGFSLQDQSLVLAANDSVQGDGPRLIQVDVGSDFAGEPIPAVLEKLDMHFDAPDRVKIVKRCWPKIIANDGVEITFRIGASMAPSSPIEWSNPVTIVKGQADEYVDTFAQGRYISFEATSNGGNPWTLTGFDLEVSARGHH